MLDLNKHTHRRFNPLTGEWVLVSPHRTSRPWQGQIEDSAAVELPEYDPECYLCPGNSRAAGVRNPAYESTFVFDNDFPAMLPGSFTQVFSQNSLLLVEGEQGICRVLCFSPRHDLTISEMSKMDIRKVVDAWTDQFNLLGSMPFCNYVQIFENRGSMMGASNPHPHCQIWASESVPDQPAKELVSFENYFDANRSCLLCDYSVLESEERERVVCENEDFLTVVPFWAVWPFETLILSKRHVTGIDQLNVRERDNQADILKQMTGLYDKLFDCQFPYSMGFHQRPTDGKSHREFHCHAHFFPPLLRSATVRKFMVGFEMLGSPQRDITAEEAATRLRDAK